ncbi:MAG: dephospho-CoA kinase, partial [Proteobacteria bacterium]
MKWIGITGGIATGKSTVSQEIRTLGHIVIDADHIVRALTSKDGVALSEIFRVFGLGLK